MSFAYSSPVGGMLVGVNDLLLTILLIIIIIEGLSLLQSIPPTTADKQINNIDYYYYCRKHLDEAVQAIKPLATNSSMPHTSPLLLIVACHAQARMAFLRVTRVV